jgi:hypothetical protein
MPGFGRNWTRTAPLQIELDAAYVKGGSEESAACPGGQFTVKRSRNSKEQVRVLQKPAPSKADSRIVAVSKKAKAGLSESTPAVSVKKLSEEHERIDSAVEKMEESSGIKAPSVADKLLLQAESATLPHWRTKDSTPGQRLELAGSALAEMEPSNVTEAMLATQMIAAHDAALLFVSQATLTETSEERRNDNTERACKFLTLFIQQMDAMQRLKGKTGRQKVIVEHVHVYKGGQAIVGAVTPRGPGEGVGDGSENR